MSKAPSMPMYWDAYLADTTHLSTEEHGAYLLLLAAMWRRNGQVPDDDKDNARIVGLTPAKWRRIKARLLETIGGLSVEGDDLVQSKLRKTWQETQQKIEKNRANGRAGGRPKSKPDSSENSDLVKANGSVSDNPSESKPEPEPEPEPKVSKGSANALQCADDVSVAFDDFAEAAQRNGWPKPQSLNKARRKAIAARLRECGGLDGWRHAIGMAEQSDFIRNSTFFGLDWMAGPKNFTKLMEGNYENRNSNASAKGKGMAALYLGIAGGRDMAEGNESAGCGNPAESETTGQSGFHRPESRGASQPIPFNVAAGWRDG